MIAGAMLTAWVSAHNGLNVRAEPSQDAAVVAVVPFGTEVEGIAKDGWLKAENGYMSVEWLTDEDPLEDYTYLGEWLTTAYTHTGACCADGSYPEAGYSVATNTLPLGTELYIEGIGFCTVTDMGPSSMPGEWLDIFMDGYSDCVRHGEQYHGVWIVPEGGDADD